MASLQLITFSVVGGGYFPFDMLRYDRCWPRHSRDVPGLTSRDSVESRMVDLVTFLDRSKTETRRLVAEGKVPTIERWRSFGWEVTDVQVIT